MVKKWRTKIQVAIVLSFKITGGERTRVSADTLVKMAEEYFAASANLQTLRIYWKPILLEIIVAGMRHTEAEFQVAIDSHSAVIPTWKVAWWRGWCTFQFSRCRGWLFFMSRVSPRWTRVTPGQTVIAISRFHFCYSCFFLSPGQFYQIKNTINQNLIDNERCGLHR